MLELMPEILEKLAPVSDFHFHVLYQQTHFHFKLWTWDQLRKSSFIFITHRTVVRIGKYRWLYLLQILFTLLIDILIPDLFGRLSAIWVQMLNSLHLCQDLQNNQKDIVLIHIGFPIIYVEFNAALHAFGNKDREYVVEYLHFFQLFFEKLE